MKLKTVEVSGKVYAEVLDGKPLYVEDDGKEIAIDVPHTRTTITRLNGESKAFRERAEKAEGDLKKFEGLDDPEAARKAIEMLSNIDSGKLMTGEKAQEYKAGLKKAAEDQVAADRKLHAEKLASAEKERDAAVGKVYSLMIDGAFANSKMIKEKSAVDADVHKAIFAGAFKVEDGKIVGYDPGGSKLYSRAKTGEIAEFEEGLGMLWDGYPFRDQLLKGPNQSGSGARPAGGGSNGSKKSITRAEFDKLDPVAQGKAAYGKDAMTITD